jgi:hypothetical protein
MSTDHSVVDAMSSEPSIKIIFGLSGQPGEDQNGVLDGDKRQH